MLARALKSTTLASLRLSKYSLISHCYYYQTQNTANMNRVFMRWEKLMINASFTLLLL